MDGRPAGTRHLEPDERRKPEHTQGNRGSAVENVSRNSHIPGARQSRSRAGEQVPVYKLYGFLGCVGRRAGVCGRFRTAVLKLL